MLKRYILSKIVISAFFLSAIDLGYNYHPIVADSDGDGLNDGLEILHNKSNYLNLDSDGDGLNDGLEVYVYETNPSSKDSDMDRIEDRLEIEEYGTDPNGNVNPIICRVESWAPSK